LIHPPGGG
jgi:hypothetical protein